MTALKKENYKNKLWYSSKISQYKTEKLLRSFANHLSVVDAAANAKVSTATVKKYYFQFRKTLFYAAFGYGELFNGAGLCLAIGPPPNVGEAKRLANTRQQGKARESNWFLWEVLIRAYAGYFFTVSEKTLIKFIVTARLAVFHKTAINEYGDFPILKELGLIPENPTLEATIAELGGEDCFGKKTDAAILEVWGAIIRGEFNVPEYIWDYMFTGRVRRPSNEVIYKDLRWYLLKHPINGGRLELSAKRQGHILPNQEDYNAELIKLIRFARNRKLHS